MEADRMKLKNTALTNEVSVWTPSKKRYSSTPDWGMEIGQGDGGCFTEPGIEKILAAMVYYKIEDDSKIKVRLGQGNRTKLKFFHEYKDRDFPLTAFFPNVYLDGNLLERQSLVLFLVKNLREKTKKGGANSHYGECVLKFSDSLIYNGKEVNKKCFAEISKVYGVKSWAILKMDIKNGTDLHLYGIKISDKITKYKFSKKRDEDFAELWNNQHPDLTLEERPQKNEEKKRRRTRKAFSPSQAIYYGVPGSGKSWQVQKDLEKKGITEKNGRMIRVVFHPDYSNADFVGQILPVVRSGKGVDYQFKPGPFTKILRLAYENGDKEYALVIEEINRGNAAAIFGDLFQLLDRIPRDTKAEEVNGNLYGPGWSSYCICNDYINAYFREEKKEDGCVVISSSNVLYDIYVNENVGIRLPPNLSIYATMNSSDQNVFFLDNAFQRRWEMKWISNEFEKSDKKQYNQTIGKTKVKWGEFHDKINEIIVDLAQENALSSMEDKRLGCWFVVPKNEPSSKLPIISLDSFAEKVLKYLWDDAFKFDRDKIFEDDDGEEFKSLDDLIKAFKSSKFGVFKDPGIKSLGKTKKNNE